MFSFLTEEILPRFFCKNFCGSILDTDFLEKRVSGGWEFLAFVFGKEERVESFSVGNFLEFWRWIDFSSWEENVIGAWKELSEFPLEIDFALWEKDISGPLEEKSPTLSTDVSRVVAEKVPESPEKNILDRRAEKDSGVVEETALKFCVKKDSSFCDCMIPVSREGNLSYSVVGRGAWGYCSWPSAKICCTLIKYIHFEFCS